MPNVNAKSLKLAVKMTGEWCVVNVKGYYLARVHLGNPNVTNSLGIVVLGLFQSRDYDTDPRY